MPHIRAGLEPGTFRFSTLRLNHFATQGGGVCTQGGGYIHTNRRLALSKQRRRDGHTGIPGGPGEAESLALHVSA